MLFTYIQLFSFLLISISTKPNLHPLAATRGSSDDVINTEEKLKTVSIC